MMLLTFMNSCPSMKVMEPGFGTGAPMAYRIPNSAPIFPVLPTRLHTHVPQSVSGQKGFTRNARPLGGLQRMIELLGGLGIIFMLPRESWAGFWKLHGIPEIPMLSPNIPCQDLRAPHDNNGACPSLDFTAAHLAAST